MVNRKLVRPNLAQLRERMSGETQEGQSREHGPSSRRRPAPPESTAAEAFYYLKQMNTQTPMIVMLDNGEKLTGHIEWYDRNCLKVHRQDAPNLLVFKHCIRYIYKQEDETGEPASES